MKSDKQIANYEWYLTSVDQGIWYSGPKVEAPNKDIAYERFLKELTNRMRSLHSYHDGFEYVTGISHSKNNEINFTLELQCGIINAEARYWIIQGNEI
jgi:hypothetical protein